MGMSSFNVEKDLAFAFMEADDFIMKSDFKKALEPLTEIFQKYPSISESPMYMGLVERTAHVLLRNGLVIEADVVFDHYRKGVDPYEFSERAKETSRSLKHCLGKMNSTDKNVRLPARKYGGYTGNAAYHLVAG